MKQAVFLEDLTLFVSKQEPTKQLWRKVSIVNLTLNIRFIYFKLMSKGKQLPNDSDMSTSKVLDEQISIQEVQTQQTFQIKQPQGNSIWISNQSGNWTKACITAIFVVVTFIAIFQAIFFFQIIHQKSYLSQPSINKTAINSDSNQNNIETQILTKIQKLQEGVLKLEAKLQINFKQIQKLQTDFVTANEKHQQRDEDKKQNVDKRKQQDLIDNKLFNSTSESNKTQSINSSNSIIKFTLRQKMRDHIPQKPKNKDYYQFNVSTSELLKINTNQNIDKDTVVMKGPKQSELQMAIQLLEVVHNVNYKGEFVFDHFQFYPSPEAKALALSKILQEEKDYYDKKYQINNYSKNQIPLCVFISSYNNAKNRLYLRNLDSLFQQQYQNYHVVYINDASTDGTGDYVKFYMEENEIPSEKYVIINNEKNQGYIPNIINAAYNHCKKGEIMVLLDGDDSLIGRQVFSFLNAVYQREKVALTYGQCLQVIQDINNMISYVKFSIEIPQPFLKQGTFRKLRSFYTSHLKTMYVDVFRKIRDDEFKDNQGNFFQTVSDVVFMTPAVELVGERLKFVHQLIYEYRFGTGNNDQSPKKMDTVYEVMRKEPHKRLQSMPFADNPKTIHYP